MINLEYHKGLVIDNNILSILRLSLYFYPINIYFLLKYFDSGLLVGGLGESTYLQTS